MSLTDEQKRAIQIQVLGSEEAGRLWSSTLNTVRAFARETGCPLGSDMFDWFRQRWEAYAEAVREAMRRQGMH